MTNIIKAIEGDIDGMFNSIKGDWVKLDAEVQAASIKASSVIAIVTQFTGTVTGELVMAAFQKIDPAITETEVFTFLTKVNNTINVESKITDSTDIETVFTTLQTYLNGLPPNTWITITKTAVAILIDLFVPGLSIIARVELCIEYVYQKFVKSEVDSWLGIAA